MIEYTRELKMKLPPTETQHISHEITDEVIENFNMNNFEIKENYFVKYMPYSWEGGYLIIKKDKLLFNEKLSKMKSNIILAQVALLLLFASISYFLARRALKPMQNAINKLDNFSKDLIHDLNTPITSILLNMQLLDANEAFKNNKQLLRIKQSAQDIGELHNNLSLLLQEGSLSIKKENITPLIEELVEVHKKIYKNINFVLPKKPFYAIANKEALKQILSNILSNACKYNKQDGFVKISINNNVLCIEDSGMGIKNPSRIFERSYKEHKSGHGIGLDIVKRLCDAMEIEIKATSKIECGTTVFLKFKY